MQNLTVTEDTGDGVVRIHEELRKTGVWGLEIRKEVSTGFAAAKAGARTRVSLGLSESARPCTPQHPAAACSLLQGDRIVRGSRSVNMKYSGA